MESAFTYGLRLFRGTIHVPNYGRSDMQMMAIGKSGGRFLKMAQNLDICISWARTIFHSTQSSGLR